MTTPFYMAALAALDETPREEATQVFVSPLGDQTTEIERVAETAAFVSRPDPSKEIEAAAAVPVPATNVVNSNRRSAFSEAAGLYL